MLLWGERRTADTVFQAPAVLLVPGLAGSPVGHWKSPPTGSIPVRSRGFFTFTKRGATCPRHHDVNEVGL
jgi:hypothetical protein